MRSFTGLVIGLILGGAAVVGAEVNLESRYLKASDLLAAPALFQRGYVLGTKDAYANSLVVMFDARGIRDKISQDMFLDHVAGCLLDVRKLGGIEHLSDLTRILFYRMALDDKKDKLDAATMIFYHACD